MNVLKGVLNSLAFGLSVGFWVTVHLEGGESIQLVNQVFSQLHQMVLVRHFNHTTKRILFLLCQQYDIWYSGSDISPKLATALDPR